MNKIKNIIVLISIIILFGIIFVVAHYFGTRESVRSEKPIIICVPHNAPAENQKCFWTAHIHAKVKIFQHNKEIKIGFEQGSLENVHTHAEKNKLHWHGLIYVDPKVKQLTDYSSFKLDKIPQDLGLSIKGSPRFMLNGKQAQPSDIWKDGDEIEIYYE